MVRMGNIVADERGLAWGPKFARHFARWDEVTYYSDQPRSGVSNKDFVSVPWQGVVRTRSGTLTFGEGEQREGQRLRAYIAERATSAVIRRWGLDRRDPKDWPPVYRFDTFITKEVLRRMRHWPWLGAAFALAYFGWQWGTTRTVPGWG